MRALLVVLNLCISAISFAQNGNVEGKVNNSKTGVVISSVSIEVVGGSSIKSTNIDGQFFLSLPSFSFSSQINVFFALHKVCNILNASNSTLNSKMNTHFFNMNTHFFERCAHFFNMSIHSFNLNTYFFNINTHFS